MKSHDREFQALIRRLVQTLQEELRQNQRLIRLVRRKKETRLAAVPEDLDGLLRSERELITNAVTVERDRISLVTELGELIDHPQPSRLRIAEILLYAEAECRDELLDLRDEFRDIADELDDLTAVDPLFAMQRNDQVRVYATASRSMAVLGVPPEAVGSKTHCKAGATPGRE